MGAPKHKQEAEKAFHEAITDGEIAPESLILAVMRGQATYLNSAGEKVEITDRMYQAAKDLIPYRLPRLNSIDATTKNVGMTHEEWIREMEGEGDDGQGDG